MSPVDPPCPPAVGTVEIDPDLVVDCGGDDALRVSVCNDIAVATDPEVISLLEELSSCCDTGNGFLADIETNTTAVVPSFAHGQNTDIDSSADEQIVVGSNPAVKGVIVKALPGNTGIVYVGLTGVTTITGFPLEAGETVTIPVDDANKVYARADADNQGVAWITA